MKIRPQGLTALLLMAGSAHAEVSANLGYASDYHYRGIFQASSSVNAGLEYSYGSFVLGTWVADVTNGLEVDGYVAYTVEAGDFSYSIGYTGYFYTDEFDDTYQEINLGTGYGIASLDVAIGQYDNFDGPTQDYTYYSLTFATNGFYGTYAGFARDFAGEYVEAGYNTTVAELDLGIAAIFANSDLLGESDQSLVLTVGKSFDIH